MYHKRIAVDLAKNVFQLAESDHSGKVITRKRLNRSAFHKALTQLTEPTEIIIEACGTAHHWGRVIQRLGHKVTLLNARHVSPFRRGNKTIETIVMRFWMQRVPLISNPFPLKPNCNNISNTYIACANYGNRIARNVLIYYVASFVSKVLIALLEECLF
jgi:hypothetical protein